MAYWNIVKSGHNSNVTWVKRGGHSQNKVEFVTGRILQYSGNDDRTLKNKYEDTCLSGSRGGLHQKGTDMSQTKSQKKRIKNVRQRGSTWSYIIYPKDPITGMVSRPKWVGGFKSEKDAETARRIAQAEIDAGIYKCYSNMTVEQYLNLWFSTHSKGIEAGTAQGYWNNIRLHIIPNIGKVKLRNLDRHKITAFYDRLQKEKGLSPKTIWYVHATFRKALNDAVADDLLIKNPCKDAKCPKAEKFYAEILDEAQVRILIQGVLGSPIETEVLLMASLGLRRGEALGVRFSDVDFDNAIICIKQQVTNVGKEGSQKQEWGIKGLKTDGSNRNLYLPDFVIDSIRARKKRVAEDRLRLGAAYQNNDLICCNDNGSFKSPQTVYHQFKKLLKKLELPDIRLHDLRHTCASLLFDKDVPLKVISQTLGHSTISITADTYVNALNKQQQPADIMQGLFGAK